MATMLILFVDCNKSCIPNVSLLFYYYVFSQCLFSNYVTLQGVYVRHFWVNILNRRYINGQLSQLCCWCFHMQVLFSPQCFRLWKFTRYIFYVTNVSVEVKSSMVEIILTKVSSPYFPYFFYFETYLCKLVLTVFCGLRKITLRPRSFCNFTLKISCYIYF